MKYEGSLTCSQEPPLSPMNSVHMYKSTFNIHLITLFYHLRLDLPSSLFLSGVPTKIEGSSAKTGYLQL
jgi:hypothetical protein